MKQQEFDAVVEKRIAAIRALLASKGAEYSSQDDRLENFKIGAALQETSPLKAAWSYCTKHLASVIKMLRNPTKYTLLQWEEKLGDAVNYFIILEAILSQALRGPVSVPEWSAEPLHSKPAPPLKSASVDVGWSPDPSVPMETNLPGNVICVDPVTGKATVVEYRK